MSRILLADGLLIDGSGGAARPGDLLIDGDRIAAVGAMARPPDATVVNCAGLVVAPGFIDGHSHSDLQVLDNRPEKVRQGVTTEVVGNCGFSPYPAPAARDRLREFANPILGGGDDWAWEGAGAYLAEAGRSATLANVVSLVGHGSLRIAAAGMRHGALSAAERDRMEGLLEDSLDQGAAGLSTGLMYAPGESAPFAELERLCRIVARRGLVHTSHIRSYTWTLVEAVEEQIELARRTGCRAQISHLQAVGPANWEQQAVAIEKIERARGEGCDIAFDCYPYVAGSTTFTQFLPQWALAGGAAAMLERLRRTGDRARIARETVASLAQRWSDLYVSATGSEAGRALVGRNLEEIAATRGVEPVEALLDLILEESGDVHVLEFNQTEDNLRQLVSHPLSAIVSDGFYVSGRPHPRLFGTFPFLLGEMVRERRWLPLEEAIRKITSVPGARFALRDRGRLEPGCFADVTVFDAARIASPATYEEPALAPVGIHRVYRNGVEVDGGVTLTARPQAFDLPT